ncbi:MAG: biotin--[acetyl-CoA-carboxylase] ligase [Hyphomicrobiaceae bacterium]|nr:biotin--[acetyl-CoA-carboxylase] ligase [Hyphomicrobiaceae bacterium]
MSCSCSPSRFPRSARRSSRRQVLRRDLCACEDGGGTAVRTPRCHLATCRSTNDEAMVRALAGETGPLWISADAQTGARGRAGRGWTGHADNLQASYLGAAACPPSSLGQVALVAGLALYDAVVAVSATSPPRDLRLKWPNDLMIGPAKCAGILVETTLRPADPAAGGAQGYALVIGFGVNVAVAPAGLDRLVTSLSTHGMSASRDELLDALDCAIATRLTQWREGRGFPEVCEAWLAASGPLGVAITVNAGERIVRGVYAGIDPGGSLVVTGPDGVTQALHFGDVDLPSD